MTHSVFASWCQLPQVQLRIEKIAPGGSISALRSFAGWKTCSESWTLNTQPCHRSATSAARLSDCYDTHSCQRPKFSYKHLKQSTVTLVSRYCTTTNVKSFPTGFFWRPRRMPSKYWSRSPHVTVTHIDTTAQVEASHLHTALMLHHLYLFSI